LDIPSTISNFIILLINQMFNNISDLGQLEQRKQQLLANTQTGYGDIEKQLAEQEALMGSQAQAQTVAQQNRLAQAQLAAENQARASTLGARQNYADLMTQSRRQARAVGGAPGSGVMELYNKLDMGLGQELGNIGRQRSGTVGQAQDETNQALMDIENKKTEQINLINQDRRKSLREKQAALQDIEMQAMSLAEQIKQAAAARRAARRASSGGYGSYGGGMVATDPNAGGQVQGLNNIGESSATISDEELWAMDPNQLYSLLIGNSPSGSPEWKIWQAKTQQPTNPVMNTPAKSPLPLQRKDPMASTNKLLLRR
jgi:hypothetical protein